MYSLGRNSFRLEKKKKHTTTNAEMNQFFLLKYELVTRTDLFSWRLEWIHWLTLRTQACVYALCEVQTESGPGCLRTRRPCQKRRGVNHLGCHLSPERQKKEKGFWVSGMSCQFSVREYSLYIMSSHRWDVSDLHVEQIELDRVSGVDVLVRVEELASEQKGLVLIHPLFSERPAVIQPVHWQITATGIGF